MAILFYLASEAMPFGGESLRARVVLGETGSPGVLGRVVGSRRSQSSRTMAFSALLWCWGKMLSSTALFILFYFSHPGKRNLVLETEQIPFFSSRFPVGLTYIQPDLCVGVSSVISIVS